MKRVIDYQKCIGCQACVSDCVNGFLSVCGDSEDDRYSRPVFPDKGRCLDCGHCEAICPKGAITREDDDEDVSEPEGLLKEMSLKRTVRSYIKGSHIDKNKLDAVITAGQSAPTDRNRKTGRILLVKDCLPEVYNKSVDWLVSEVEKTGPINPLYKPTLAMAEKRDEILWNAEYLVVIAGSPEYVVDAAISAERMQLMADSLGIGTGYRGDIKKAINNNEDIRQLLGLKPREEALVTFAMGLTSRSYYRGSIKYNRKVEYL